MLVLSGCQAAVTTPEPEPEPPPEAAFVGTVWTYTDGWYLELDGEETMVGTATYTLTFTKSRWILRRSVMPNDNFPEGESLREHEYSPSGGWSATATTITKAFYDWNDEEERPEDMPTLVERYYGMSGDTLLMQWWEGDDPRDPYVAVKPVMPVDIQGEWLRKGASEDGTESSTERMTLDDGQFTWEYTEYEADELARQVVLTGTYELDEAEQFILLAIEELKINEKVSDSARWQPGAMIRFAWATVSTDRVAVSVNWDEVEWNEASQQWEDHSEVRHGDYWRVMTRVP